jgi:tetratricopeptide (TPR) repeat protein
VLEADFADSVAAEPELLARHLTEAGLFEEAVPWWQRAGERATERSANHEAIAHLKRGIEILERLPESPERDERELQLHAALLAPLGANEGWASPARKRAAERAVEFGSRIPTDSPAQPQALCAVGDLANVQMHRGELRTGLALAGQALALAERFGDPLLLSNEHQHMGQFYLSGDIGAARRHFERGFALYDPGCDRVQVARIGYDLRMAFHSWLGVVLWDLGFPDEALRHVEEAIAAARAAAHPRRMSDSVIRHGAPIWRNARRALFRSAVSSLRVGDSRWGTKTLTCRQAD